MFTELLPNITRTSASTSDKEKQIQLFFSQFDVYFENFIEDTFPIKNFLQDITTVYELTKDFYYRDNKDLPYSFFLLLNELYNIFDYFKAGENSSFNYESIFFSNLNENIQEIFISIDTILTAFKSTKEYLNDIQERTLDELDFALIAEKEISDAEELLIKQFYKHPDIEFKDLQTLAKIGSSKTDELLLDILFSSKYHNFAELNSLAFLLAIRKYPIKEILERKYYLWNTFDSKSGKFFSEIIKLWADNLDKKIKNPAYSLLANSDNIEFNHLAVILIIELDLYLDFDDFKLIKTLLSKQATTERINDEIHDREDYYFIAEKFADYLNTLSTKSLKTIFIPNDSFEKFISLTLFLPEAVFNTLSPLIYQSYEILLGEEEFVKRLEVIIKKEGYQKYFTDSRFSNVDEILKTNLSMLANMLSLDLEGSSLKELRFA